MYDQDDDLAFCQNELKKTNPVRHFEALTAHQDHRAGLMAFYAFTNEMARIPHQVSDPAMGEIRLQWWLDVIDSPDCDSSAGCGAMNIGPVGRGLKYAQRRYHLPTDRLKQIIEARRFDLYNDPMPDMATCETYLGETRAIPLMLASQILMDGAEPDTIADLCGHAAMAIGLTGHLTHWQRDAARQRLFLPLDGFEREGLSPARIFAQAPSEELAGALARGLNAYADLADRYHARARADFQTLDGTMRAKILPAVLGLSHVPKRLKAVRKAPFEVKEPAHWRSYLTVWRTTAFGL